MVKKIAATKLGSEKGNSRKKLVSNILGMVLAGFASAPPVDLLSGSV